MAYNNNFPVNYYPYLQGTQMPLANNSQTPTQPGIIWVQGEAGAKSYLVAPNSTVCLWDSESQTIYIKSADASGMPNMKTLDYTIRENGVPHTEHVDYVTRDELKEEFDSIKKDFNDLRSRVEDMKKGNYVKGKVMRNE